MTSIDTTAVIERARTMARSGLYGGWESIWIIILEEGQRNATAVFADPALRDELDRLCHAHAPRGRDGAA